MECTANEILESLIHNVYEVQADWPSESLVEGTLDAFVSDFIALHEAILAGDIPDLWRTNGPE